MDIDDIHTIGVVGCGLMGAGIVEVCARAGYQVVVREVNDELLQRGLQRIRASMSRAVEKGKLTKADMESAFSRIQGTLSMTDFKDCDLVIEAVVENMQTKKTVFTELDSICRTDAILATNTSSLCVTEMAAVTERPDRVVGMHFFNPVPVMQLLEVVRALLTSDETLELAKAFGTRLGKTVVVARDRPGFIANLLFVPYALDAIRWLDAGLATKEEIDATMKLGFNHPMGPFTLMDFVGLDTLLFIADAMYEEFKDDRYAAPPLLRRMVQAGLWGRKSGRGFYDYSK